MKEVGVKMDEKDAAQMFGRERVRVMAYPPRRTTLKGRQLGVCAVVVTAAAADRVAATSRVAKGRDVG